MPSFPLVPTEKKRSSLKSRGIFPILKRLQFTGSICSDLFAELSRNRVYLLKESGSERIVSNAKYGDGVWSVVTELMEFRSRETVLRSVIQHFVILNVYPYFICHQ